MALKYTGTGIFKYGLDVQGQFPLDSRIVVQNASDLTNYKTLFVSGGVPTWYIGMTVFAEDTKKLYVLQSETEGFAPVGADESQLANLFNYKGNVESYDALPTEGQKVGDVYNIDTDFEVTIPGGELEEDVVKQYPAGTNVAWNGSDWDPLAGSIDLSGYATKIELTNLGSTVADNSTNIGNLTSALNETNAEVAKKVDAVEGSSLISAEKLALIDTNAGDIETLKQNVSDLNDVDTNYLSRIQTLENLVGIKEDGTPGETASLEVRVSANESAISSLQSDNTTNKSNIASLQESVADHETRITNVVEVNAAQTTSIQEMSTKVSTLEGGVSSLTITTGEHTTAIGNIQTSVNGVNERLAAVESDYLKAADIEGKLDTSVYEAKVLKLEQADTNNLQAAKDYADDLKVTIDAAYVAADAKVLSDAKAYADGLVYDDSALEARVKANEDKLVVLNGEDTVDGSVAKQVKDAINDFATKISDNQTIDTFKELIDYAATHGSEFSTLSGSVQANTTALEVLNGGADKAGSVAKAVKDAVDAEAAIARAAEEANAAAIKAISDDYLKAEHKTALEGLITAEANRAKGVEEGLDARLLVVEGDYLKKADKEALQLSIDAKVAQADYDVKIAALEKADTDNLAAAKAYTDAAFEWITV